MADDTLTIEAARDVGQNTRGLLKLLFDDTQVPQIVARDVDRVIRYLEEQMTQNKALRAKLEAAEAERDRLRELALEYADVLCCLQAAASADGVFPVALAAAQMASDLRDRAALKDGEDQSNA